MLGATGQLARAEEIARELVKLEPENAAAFGRLAWVLAERRTYEEAAVMARESIRLDPNNYAAWANLGYAAMERQTASPKQGGHASGAAPAAGAAVGDDEPRGDSSSAQGQRRGRAAAGGVVRARPGEQVVPRSAGRVGLLAQESALRWSDRAVLTVLLVIVAVPAAIAFPGVAFAVAAVAFALAWLLWKMK